MFSCSEKIFVTLTFFRSFDISSKIPQDGKDKSITTTRCKDKGKTSNCLAVLRVSHETCQMVNSFKCILPTVVDVKDFLQFI